MKKGMWVRCPVCKQLCMAGTTWFGKKIVCEQCGGIVDRKDELASWECPDCGRIIFGGKDIIDSLACPCGYRPAQPEPEPEPEPEPVPESEPEPEPEPELNLQCPVCGGGLKRWEGGARCAICFTIVPQQEIERMQALGASNRAITIAWNNAADSPQRIFVHPHSSQVPTESALIVGEHQLALYQAAGTYHPKGPGTHSIFWDELSESATLHALRPGEQNKEYPIQLNTKIIFFDTRQSDHRYTAQESISLYGTGYQFLPDVRYRLRIVNPRQIMGISLNRGIAAESADLEANIVRWAEEAIRAIITNLISQRFQKPLMGDPDPLHTVKNQLFDLFDQGNLYASLTEKINAFLIHGERGIELSGIDGITIDGALTAEIPDSQAAECPNCHTRVLRMRPGTRFECPNCDTTMWYCTSAGCGCMNFHPKNVFQRFCSTCGAAIYFNN